MFSKSLNGKCRMRMDMAKLAVAIFFITLFGSSQASTVSVVQVRSDKMDKDISVSIILSDAYQNSADPLPVLYLLHGAGDDHLKWIQKTDIETLADTYNMIIVCPAAGRTSWYFDSPIDPTYQYETFVSVELVTYVDKHYRTLKTRNFRAISGNSMGGHGAMFLAIRHQDVFGIVGCLSGGVDIRPFPGKWDIHKRLGTYAKHKDLWEAMSVVTLAKTLKNNDLQICIDCGSSDFFIDVNRALHQQLLDDKIEHVYTERPGGHTWTYWDNSIKYQMLFFSEYFSKSRKDKS